MPTYKISDFENENAVENTTEESNLKLKGGVVSEDETEEEVSETPLDDSTTDSTAAKSNKYKLSEIELDDEDLPEDLRGKFTKGGDLLQAFNQLRSYTGDLIKKLNTPAEKEETIEEDEPLLTEDDLGVGADPKTVESKLDRLVAKRLEPYALTVLQETSEKHARALLKDKENYPYAERFTKEIMELAGQYELTETAKPALWQNLYTQVIGRNMATILKEARENPSENPNPKPKAGATEKGNNGASGGKRGSSTTSDDFESRVKNAKLSPNQEMVVANLPEGITREDYIRTGLKMGTEFNGKD